MNILLPSPFGRGAGGEGEPVWFAKCSSALSKPVLRRSLEKQQIGCDLRLSEGRLRLEISAFPSSPALLPQEKGARLIVELCMNRKDPIEFARRLRKTTNSSEGYLWQLLRNRQRCGMKFRRQHPLGPYTADFYCLEAKLVVELDGEPHCTPEGKRKDEARDAWMRSQGIEVLRVGGWQAENDAQRVLEMIDAMLLARCPKPEPR